MLHRFFGLPTWEMPLYHRSETENLVCQQFRAQNGTERALMLNRDEKLIRASMIASYVSQTDVGDFVSAGVELHRPQPECDYSRPPHPGPLNYEVWQWPIPALEVCRAFEHGASYWRMCGALMPLHFPPQISRLRPMSPQGHKEGAAMAGVPARSRGRAVARARDSISARHLLLPVQKFVHTEVSGGLVLLAAAVAALVWANSRWAGSYEALWTTEVSLHAGRFVLAHSLRDWVNDALMVVFFFVVGLEVKREFLRGALSDWQRASLPVAAAVGGMAVPALLYTAFNYAQPTARGWGIPMATDIAFALGVLALVGDRIPASLRIFLLALATVDDIGAILVIAVFYSDRLVPTALVFAFVLIAAIVAMQRLGVRNLLYYAPVAVLFWFAVMQLGVHTTIAGVVLGVLTPIRPYVAKDAFSKSAPQLFGEVQQATAAGQNDRGDELLGELEELTAATEAPSDRLIRLIHPWSSFLVLPVFALANAGVAVSTAMLRQALTSPASRGIFVGLVVGKVVGIVLFAFVAVRLGVARLAGDARWPQMVGVGVLGGIGFTVSLFISDLAFADAAINARAKLGVLVASLVAGFAGYLMLRLVSVRSVPSDANGLDVSV